MKKPLRRFRAPLLLTLALAGCNPSNPELDTREQSILRGGSSSAEGHVNIGGRCSGRLVANRYVLTAASCLNGSGASEVTMGGQRAGIANRVTHPSYTS